MFIYLVTNCLNLNVFLKYKKFYSLALPSKIRTSVNMHSFFPLSFFAFSFSTHTLHSLTRTFSLALSLVLFSRCCVTCGVFSSVTMSVTESKSTTDVSYVLKIRVSPSLGTRPSCTVRVRKGTTAALVVQSIAELLELDSSRLYELVEVRKHEGDKHVLQVDQCPVDRLLLWPQGHEESQGYYFIFQEGFRDMPGQYGTVQDLLKSQHEDVKDLCCLTVLNEASILETLRCRFYKNQIYTYASNILITINPFKFLPIYNPKDLQRYENCTLGKENPHIFAIADAAFRAMLNKRTNQCIVISGESGSGKTQSTNFLIHCLTTLSKKGCTSGVERTILGAGPVLEVMISASNTLTNENQGSSKVTFMLNEQSLLL